MSCNIYEDPDLTMKVRYSKGVRAKRGERVEKKVEIYESSDTSTNLHVGPIRQDGGEQTGRRGQDLQRNNYRIAALILGLLCLVLLGGIGVLLNLYLMVLSKLESNSTQMKNPIQRSNENQTQVKTTEGWHWFRKQCFYVSTEKKNWTESRKDCQRRGADLVIISNKDKHELVKKVTIHGESWIGLETVTPQWNDKWEWIDGTEPIYWSWKEGEPKNPEVDSRVYTDLQGNWMKTKNGTKHWICEKTTC